MCALSNIARVSPWHFVSFTDINLQINLLDIINNTYFTDFKQSNRMSAGFQNVG